MRRLSSLLVLVSLTGCGHNGLALRDDDRVQIVRPAERARVTLPVRLDWRGPSGIYAVFVDRAPMPPGKDLEWLARNDDSCRRSPACPDRAWFNAHGVFVTESHAVVIPAIPAAAGRRKRSDGGHRAVLVRLGDGGRRHGELATARTFRVVGS